MRGKLRNAARKLNTDRITPAHAGKTNTSTGSELFVEDHPRACGENSNHSGCLANSEGSPPRMRGKPPNRANTSSSPRITPAHAGKTNSSHVLVLLSQDHPRACGENVGRLIVFLSRIGSPPRMRGKHESVLLEVQRQRITPAHAGKTKTGY